MIDVLLVTRLHRIDHLQEYTPDPLIVPPHELSVADEISEVATDAQLENDEDILVIKDDVAHGEDVGVICAFIVRVALEDLAVPLRSTRFGSVKSFDGDFGALWSGGVDGAEDRAEGAATDEVDQDVSVAYN